MNELPVETIKRVVPRPGTHIKHHFLVRKEAEISMSKPQVNHNTEETLEKTNTMLIHLEKWLFRMRR